MSLRDKLVQIRKDARFAATVARRAPFNCLVQVTNRCNLRCSFCDFWPNPAPPEQELTVDEYADVAEQMHQLGCFVVSIEGGEPMIRADIVDIVRTFSSHHITALFTSGWHVTPDKARALWDAGLTHACVSIDYPDRRHDDKRGLVSTSERAWRAVDLFRDSAPRGGKQVNVMTVLMDSNWRDMEALYQMSADRGVGHQVTLLSTKGARRGGSDVDRLPPAEASSELTRLWERYRHVRFFRDYFERMGTFLTGGEMPTCHAGTQSFNLDHVGNVAACIERIDEPVGNVREHRLADLFAGLAGQQDVVERCQQCWTACRGFQQALEGGGSWQSWRDMTLRTRTL
jgi:MoaA/NifB/PqqE/SkfB family radical SAM enzyme